MIFVICIYIRVCYKTIYRTNNVADSAFEIKLGRSGEAFCKNRARASV